ncbi:LCP family protein [Cellulomonas timonensis]|uniref:LCP family protein n=1 Tax=Cellulomonas timonensis TaxID=1689271 RepID=UPI001F3179A3|nr:LCP family protein [Cellulomonas timonensis]
MTIRHAASSRPRAARHSRRPRTHHVLRGVGLVMTAVLAFGATSMATALGKMEGNIDAVDVTDLLGDVPVPTSTDPSDPNAGQAMNILLLGSDQRDGENAVIGGDAAGMRSDTTIVMHISADRSRVELVSIPRDSLVDIPSCTMPDGSTSSARRNAMFNEAFAIGADRGGDMASAAACAMKTVMATTGVPLTDFAVIDFVGFIKMVGALGGIDMCIPTVMRSSDAGLDLSAGQQTLDGSTALAFARARKGVGLGDGSDTGRLGRQQEFLSAMAKTIFEKNLLTDVTGLVRFLDAATESVTASPNVARPANLAGLAFSLRSISTSNITFTTIPWAAAPSDPNRVVWTSEADAIWDNIANDRPMLSVDEAPADPAVDQSTDAGTSTGNDPAAGGTPEQPAPATTDAAAPPAPEPVQTKKAGKEAFSANDVTSTCG